MKYYMPTRLFDEENCVLNHAGDLGALGTRALIVTGRSSAAANGSLDDVREALRVSGTAFCLFSEVEENPSLETIFRARDYGLAEKADFVIGIGGGSPLDAAKAIALAMANPEAGEEEMYDGSLDSAALPVAAVPTTCGTGSEVTGVSVLTRHSRKSKGSIPYRIFPKLALTDGKYLKDAPSSLVLYTAVDALAHLLESGLSASCDVYSMMPISAGLSLWRQSLPVLLGTREAGPDDRRRMMQAASFAGMAIAQTGTSIPHALSYILTYDLGFSHGRAAGYFLPAFVKEAPQDLRSRLLSLCGFSGTEEFETCMRTLLGPEHVPEETLERAYDVVLHNAARLKTAAFPMDAEVLRRITFA